MGIPLYNIPDIRRFYGKPDPYGNSKARTCLRRSSACSLTCVCPSLASAFVGPSRMDNTPLFQLDQTFTPYVVARADRLLRGGLPHPELARHCRPHHRREPRRGTLRASICVFNAGLWCSAGQPCCFLSLATRLLSPALQPCAALLLSPSPFPFSPPPTPSNPSLQHIHPYNHNRVSSPPRGGSSASSSSPPPTSGATSRSAPTVRVMHMRR